jgi:hypothetical protein
MSSLVEHPKGVLRLVNRLSALAVTLILVGGNVALCAGWAATPEARMACCVDGDCPMHKGRSDEASSQHIVTQAEADACCATSERDQSESTNPTVVAAISAAVLGTGVVLPISTPPLVLTDGWRPEAPVPIMPVPRHILLSVFLV